MKALPSRLGILDWGIGGMGVFRLLRDRHPALPLVYWSDAGATPYGKMPTPVLAARLRNVMGALRARGVGNLIVACNAASSALPCLGVTADSDTLELPGGPIRVTGMISHAVGLTAQSGARTVGVVGGEGTIASGCYPRALEPLGLRVHQRIAQPLSALIETGEISGPRIEDLLAQILSPLQAVDTLLLACTHYPALGTLWQRYLSPQTMVLDPAPAVVSWVEAQGWPSDRAESLGEPSIHGHNAGIRDDLILTTGDPALMRRGAALAFGVHLPAIEQLGND